ncbi:MAG: twin-arginine translocation signal domain-containing protein, partial [Paracoccaceae bacterium]
MKRIKKGLTRRDMLKTSAFVSGAAATGGLMVSQNPELVVASAEAQENNEDNRTTALAQCPYCGVGCGTVIQVENGKIVSMRPDKDHPTNYGLQCIKGL